MTRAVHVGLKEYCFLVFWFSCGPSLYTAILAVDETVNHRFTEFYHQVQEKSFKYCINY